MFLLPLISLNNLSTNSEICFLTSPKQALIEPVVSNENTISIAPLLDEALLIALEPLKVEVTTTIGGGSSLLTFLA